MDKEGQDNSVDDGWIEQRHVFQKKALLFKTLAILWIVPSLTSLFVVFYNFPTGDRFLEILKLIRLEQWLSLLLLLLQPVFIYLAVRYRRTEVPTEQVTLVPNPDGDPKKLY